MAVTFQAGANATPPPNTRMASHIQAVTLDEYQLCKLAFGAAGTFTTVETGVGLPVAMQGIVTVVATGLDIRPLTSGTDSITVVATDLDIRNLSSVIDSVSVPGVSTIAGWDQSGRAAVNSIAGQVGVEGGAGVVTGATQRVAIATDANVVVIGSSALPVGAATAANQVTTIGLLTTIDADTGVIAGWDESTRAKVNLIVGQAGISSGAGAVAANTPRVTHASDDPAVVSLGVLDDWDEADRAKTNPIVGQAGVQGGAGTVTANTQRVAFATDANDVDVLTMPTGASAAQIQGTVANDSPIAQNPVRVGMRASLAVPATVSADGDTVESWSDRFGRKVTLIGVADPASPALLTATLAGNTVIIASPGAGLSIHVMKGSITAADNTGVVGSITEGNGGAARLRFVGASKGQNLLFDCGARGWKLPSNTALVAQQDINGIMVYSISEYYVAP